MERLFLTRLICSSRCTCLDHIHTTCQGEYEEADSLLLRVLEILGTTVGREHPSYASALNNRAELLRLQVRATRTHHECCCVPSLDTAVLAGLLKKAARATGR